MNYRSRIAKAISYLGLASILVFTLFPIVFLVLTSFKTLDDIFSYPPPLIFLPTLKNWNKVLVGGDFLNFYKNSILIASFTSLFVVVFGSMAGYALARFKIRGKEDLAFWILSNSMMPAIAIILPLYILFAKIGALDKIPSMILVYTAFNLPFGVWLMRSFIEDIPIVLEEAALIDGSSRFGCFFRIILPVAKPGLLAVAIYTFVQAINEFFIAFVLTGSQSKTAAVAILNFLPTGVRGTLYGEAAAASILIMLPALLLFFFMRNSFVAGLSLGAVKE